MREFDLPAIEIPPDLPIDEMPDLLRFWYLGTRARRHMVLRRFFEVNRELGERSGHVLDIGSAWGYNVMALQRMGMSVVGMDLVVDQFSAGTRIARENALGFDVLGADAARLPFGDGVFSAITMVETFEHVFDDDRRRVAEECFRVLRPGGRLVLSTPNYGSLVETFKRLAVRVPWLQRRLPTMCYPADEVARDAYHPYRYHRPATPQALAHLAESVGFRVRREKYFLFVLKNTPDRLFGLARRVEALLECTPAVRRLAATVCIVADKPTHGPA